MRRYKLKDNVDLKELEKFGYHIIPEGIYAKSINCYINIMGDRHEIFIAIEKDRTIKRYSVESYLFKVYMQKEQYLFKRNIKDLIKAGIVEKVKELG